MTRKRRRIARGVYRDRWGVSATVKVDGTQREKRFPIGTALQKIRDWQGEMRVALRASVRRGPRGSFKADAIRYLAGVRGMPSYRERERDIGFWIAEFGERRRDSITTKEMVSVLQRWNRRAVPRPR